MQGLQGIGFAFKYVQYLRLGILLSYYKPPNTQPQIYYF